MGERRTRANPSPGGFKSLDVEPRRTRRTRSKLNNTSTDTPSTTQSAPVDHEQEAAPLMEQRPPSPTPTASNSLVSAESRSASSEVDDSRSSSSPPPPPAKHIQTRSQTRSVSPSLDNAIMQYTTPKPATRAASKKRPRAEESSRDGENSNAEEAHEKHPAKRNRIDQSYTYQRDITNTEEAGQHQSPATRQSHSHQGNDMTNANEIVQQQISASQESDTHQGDDAKAPDQSVQQQPDSTQAADLSLTPQSNGITASDKTQLDRQKPSMVLPRKTIQRTQRQVATPQPKRPKRPMSVIPVEKATGEVYDAWVKEEWAIMTQRPIEHFKTLSKNAEEAFRTIIRKTNVVKTRRTFDQFKIDTENGVVLPLPSNDRSCVEENGVDSDEQELSIMDYAESPTRAGTSFRISKGTAQAGSFKGSKEIARVSSSRPSTTSPPQSALVLNPYASLQIEAHILTHSAMIEIVKAASQAFAADTARLSKPIPDAARFASFLDQYQEEGATSALPQIADAGPPADKVATSQPLDNDAEAMELGASDASNDEGSVMSDIEGDVQHEVPGPQTPSPEPKPQAQESRGWFSTASNILTSPFKFIGRGGQSAGNTPATNPLPVASESMQNGEVPRGLATPTPSGRVQRKRRAPVTARSRAASKGSARVSRNKPFLPTLSSQVEDPVPIHLRGVKDPEAIAAIHKREDDLHAEERQKKRQSRVEAEESIRWKEEYIDHFGNTNVGLWEMVDGKRRIVDKQPKHISFKVPGYSDSEEDEEDEDESDEDEEGDVEMDSNSPNATSGQERQVPPNERIFSQTRRAIGLPSPPSSAEEAQEVQFDATFGDPHRARPYTGTLLQNSNYVERNVREGRHPLFTGSTSSSTNNIFTENRNDSGDQSTLQEKKWTQSPPPKPKPSNATLPKNPISQEEVAKTQKARELAEKYKPQKPSRLCEVQQASPIHQKENAHPELMVIFEDSVEWEGDDMVNEAVGGISDDQIIDTPITDDILKAWRLSNSIDRAVAHTFNFT